MISNITFPAKKQYDTVDMAYRISANGCAVCCSCRGGWFCIVVRDDLMTVCMIRKTQLVDYVLHYIMYGQLTKLFVKGNLIVIINNYWHKNKKWLLYAACCFHLQGKATTLLLNDGPFGLSGLISAHNWLI